MLIKCPSCDHLVEVTTPPSRDDPHNDAWVCFKCPAVVCAWCYVQHNEKQHPEVYQPTKGGKKNKKGKKG